MLESLGMWNIASGQPRSPLLLVARSVGGFYRMSLFVCIVGALSYVMRIQEFVYAFS